MLVKAQAAGVACTGVETVTDAPRLVWPDVLDLPTGVLMHAYNTGLSRLIS